MSKKTIISAYMKALGQKGGTARSVAKTVAVQANGRRGGRPPVLSRAERLARIRARIDNGKAVTPKEGALHFADRMGAQAVAWAHKQHQQAQLADDRDWWREVIACLERGVA